VLLLHAKIILSWDTNVHESQITTKIDNSVRGAICLKDIMSNARLDLFILHSL
jgi:hypothetical protein